MTQRGNQDRGDHPSQGEQSQVDCPARDNRDMESRQYGGVQGNREGQQRGTYGYDTSGIQDAQGGGLGFGGYQSRYSSSQQDYGSLQGGSLDNARRKRNSATGAAINQSGGTSGSNQSESGGNRTGKTTQSGQSENGSGKGSSASSSKSK